MADHFGRLLLIFLRGQQGYCHKVFTALSISSNKNVRIYDFSFFLTKIQTIEELNKRDSEQLEKFQKMEFQQIVSQLEQTRKKETEMMKKMLNYSTHLAQNSSFKDYEDTTYPELFVY